MINDEGFAAVRGLSGKVAIVTGGATMIGAAVVDVFVGYGASVVIADIQAEAGAAVAARHGDKAAFIATDLRETSSIKACVAGTVEKFGRIDFLINVAVSYIDGALAATQADWLEALNINVVGGVMLLQEALPYLAREGGAVVNFGSISAKVAQAGRWLYPVSKAALLQLTRNQALDLAPQKIRVNSVSPGWTWSSVIESLSNGDRAKADRVAADFHLPGRLGEPLEVAEAVAFLCSDQASFITGTDLAVDGGYAAMGPEQMHPAIAKLMDAN